MRSVDEGLALACEVWGWLARRFDIEPSRTPKGRLRALVRRALFARAMASKRASNPAAARQALMARMTHLAAATDALCVLVEERLLLPEGDRLALATMGALQAHEEAVIREVLGEPVSVPEPVPVLVRRA